MNAFWIKIIAIASMVIDHVALFYFPDSFALQVMGRLSYPLIAWLIANGAVHTRNIDAYLWRLAVFALIAQVPYEIGFYLTGHHPIFLNVLFTLFLGLLAIRLLTLPVTPALRYTGVIVTLLLAAILHTDYGAGGVLSIVAFYVFFNRPLAMAVSQAFILAILTKLDFFIHPGIGSAFFMHPLEQYGLLALPIIFLYNGKKGLATGYFFYWFFVAQNFLMLYLAATR